MIPTTTRSSSTVASHSLSLPLVTRKGEIRQSVTELQNKMSALSCFSKEIIAEWIEEFNQTKEDNEWQNESALKLCYLYSKVIVPAGSFCNGSDALKLLDIQKLFKQVLSLIIPEESSVATYLAKYKEDEEQVEHYLARSEKIERATNQQMEALYATANSLNIQLKKTHNEHKEKLSKINNERKHALEQVPVKELSMHIEGVGQRLASNGSALSIVVNELSSGETQFTQHIQAVESLAEKMSL